MGYAMAIRACFGCKRIFTYHPLRVPSIRVNGTREPICATCVERANPRREKLGLAPIVPASSWTHCAPRAMPGRPHGAVLRAPFRTRSAEHSRRKMWKPSSMSLT